MITTCPVITFPVVIPTEEINVIAIDVAIVVRIGNFKITSIIGTKRNEPPAPIMPDAPPTIKVTSLLTIYYISIHHHYFVSVRTS